MHTLANQVSKFKEFQQSLLTWTFWNEPRIAEQHSWLGIRKSPNLEKEGSREQRRAVLFFVHYSYTFKKLYVCPQIQPKFQRTKYHSPLVQFRCRTNSRNVLAHVANMQSENDPCPCYHPHSCQGKHQPSDTESSEGQTSSSPAQTCVWLTQRSLQSKNTLPSAATHFITRIQSVYVKDAPDCQEILR